MAKTVLVTGADGFVGRNLCETLSRIAGLKVLKFDVESRAEDLAEFALVSDFVFHLAGVMRPNNPEEFVKVNADLTADVLSLMRKNGRRIPVLLSSSIQAALDNPYGESKRRAEQAVFVYGRKTGADVYVFRLPNVFGKWCRPNYSSAVATWCYNIAHDLPIYVRDPSAVLKLAYIEDVVGEFVAALEGRKAKPQDGFCEIPVTHARTLEQITEALYSFKSSLDNKGTPVIKDDFERDLYATFLTYCR